MDEVIRGVCLRGRFLMGVSISVGMLRFCSLLGDRGRLSIAGGLCGELMVMSLIVCAETDEYFDFCSLNGRWEYIANVTLDLSCSTDEGGNKTCATTEPMFEITPDQFVFDGAD